MLLQVARTENRNEGDVIIRKGDIGQTFYVVLEGVVVCTDASLGDDEKPPDAATEGATFTPLYCCTKQKEAIRLKAGDWFGEIALLTGMPRTANIIADSPVRLLAFDREVLCQFCNRIRMPYCSFCDDRT